MRGLLLTLLVCLVAPPVAAGEVPELIRAMKEAPSGLPKSRAYTALAEAVGEADLPLLVQEALAEREDTITGYYLILVIQRIGGDAAKASLRKLLSHELPYLASRAASALFALGDLTWLDAYLEEIAQEGDATRRAGLLGAFSSIRAPEVLDRLVSLYDRITADEVRAALVTQLANTREPRFAGLFRRAMTADGPLTRTAAIRALVGASDPAALEAFLAAVDAGEMTDSDITQVLYALRNRPAFTTAQRRLVQELLERELSTSALLALLPLVAKTRDRVSVTRLRELIDTGTDQVVAEALKALIDLEAPEDLATTLHSLEDHSSESVRLQAAVGRLILGEPEAVALVAGFLSSDSVTIRRDTVQALQAHPRRGAIPALLGRVQDPDESVRTSVIQTLQAHLRAFFPYRTPNLEALGLNATTPPEKASQIAADLRAWLEEQER